MDVDAYAAAWSASVPHAGIEAERDRAADANTPGIDVRWIDDVVALNRNDYGRHSENGRAAFLDPGATELLERRRSGRVAPVDRKIADVQLAEREIIRDVGGNCA